jgi:hypothetical protein
MDLTGLPGGDLVQEGLADLARGGESVAALLVSIGAPRLRRIGLSVPVQVFPTPELRMYELLAQSDSDSAHSRYNALIRRLVSFENTAECVGAAASIRDDGAAVLQVSDHQSCLPANPGGDPGER